MLKSLPPPGPLYIEPPRDPRADPSAFVEYVPAPRPDPLPDVETPVVEKRDGLTLAEATELLRAKVLELLPAPPAAIPALNVEILKLRIICMVLREVELNILDPSASKEFALMNKMLTGKDLDAEAERKQTIEEEQAASTVLAARGIKAESATRILRALTSIMSAREEQPDDATEPPDPE